MIQEKKLKIFMNFNTIVDDVTVTPAQEENLETIKKDQK